MGVFSWFRSKPVAAPDASASEVIAVTSAEKSEVDEGTVEAVEAAEPTGEPAGTGASAEDATGTAGAEAGEEAAAEGVDIPKQQSAEEAADSEAGEGARQ